MHPVAALLVIAVFLAAIRYPFGIIFRRLGCHWAWAFCMPIPLLNIVVLYAVGFSKKQYG